MTKLNQVYKCEICGNMVEVIHEGNGQLVCCDQPMTLLEEKIEDAGQEKHVPVIVSTKSGVMVRVGSVSHPMEKNHYIEWIEIVSNGKTYREFLKPGDKPEAEFCIKANALLVKEFCNVHGLWQAQS